MQSEGFIEVACPLCQADDSTVVCTKDFTAGVYTIVRCNRCRLAYINPQPTSVVDGTIYGQQYFQSTVAKERGYSDYVGAETEYRHAAARRSLKYVMSHLPVGEGRRLLDIGCAAGFFLNAAQDAEFSVCGVEVSAFASEYARAHFGVDVRIGMLKDVNFQSCAFDVVTMFDVIEHIADPIRELTEIARILKPGGVLVLDTPNIESDTARLQGDQWWLFKSDHLVYYAPDTIRRLFEIAGFELTSLSKELVSQWDKALKLFPGTNEGSHISVVGRVFKDAGAGASHKPAAA